MDKNKQKHFRWQRRGKRVRKKVYGDADMPRLTVFRSLRHMYAQVIDDDNGSTIVACSTRTPELNSDLKIAGNKDAAAQVGSALARKAIAVGIRRVRFDRNGYKYHGRVKAFADAAREAGLMF